MGFGAARAWMLDIHDPEVGLEIAKWKIHGPVPQRPRGLKATEGSLEVSQGAYSAMNDH